MSVRWPHGRSAGPSGLYLITPEQPDTGRLLAQVAPLLGEGVTWLQYRNKSAASALRRRQAEALQGLCRAAGVPLIINDDVQLALAIGAGGVHLGEDDDDIVDARRVLGDDVLIGASCYDQLGLATRAVAAGADYVAFGAFFHTRSKANTRSAQPSLLQEAASLGVPTVAIGGITPDNAAALVDAGADLLAVISCVFDAPDPVAAVRAYLGCFQHPRPHGVEVT